MAWARETRSSPARKRLADRALTARGATGALRSEKREYVCRNGANAESPGCKAVPCEHTYEKWLVPQQIEGKERPWGLRYELNALPIAPSGQEPREEAPSHPIAMAKTRVIHPISQ